MSIQGMRTRFAKQLRIALYVLIGAFIIGLPLVFVPGGTFNPPEENPEARGGGEVTIARVDGEPIARDEYERQFEAMVGQILPIYAQIGQSVGLDRLWQFRLEALEQAIQMQLLLEQADRDGLSVSKGEVKKKAEEMVDQQIAQIKSQYTKPEELELVLGQIVAAQEKVETGKPMSERQFRKWALERTLDPAMALREQMVMEKLRQGVVGGAPVTEQDLQQSYDTARVRHVLIALRPEGKPEHTEEQAKARAEELLARIKGGEDFAKVAAAESDDPEAKQTGGLLAEVGRGRMPEEWDKAVFALKPGEMSGALKLTWGYEIVKLEKIERKLPADFEKSKQQLMSSFQQQRQDEAWRKHTAGLRAKAKVEVVSPEMQAYGLLAQSKQDEALAKLKEAAPEARTQGGIGAASVFYQLATLLAAQGDWMGAADAYADSSDALSSEEAAMMADSRAQALLGMGRAYEQMKQPDEAAMWYTAASDASGSPSVHQELKSTFLRMGKTDLADRETEWMQNYQQMQLERQKEMEEQQKAMEQTTPGKPEGK